MGLMFFCEMTSGNNPGSGMLDQVCKICVLD